MAGSGSKIERDKGDDRGTLLTHSPLYSTTAPGDSLIFEEYVSSGVVEVPEVENRSLALILRTGSPSRFEWRGNGGDHIAELPAGSISLIPDGLRQAVRVSRPLTGIVSILEIDPSFFARTIGQIAKGRRIELIRRLNLDDPQICRMMETLCSDSSAGSPGGSALRRVHRDGTLRVYRAQQYSTLKGKLEAYRGGLSRSRLNRVQEYINANLSDKLELRVLAEVAGVNLYHFARAFKQSTDESPHQYVLRRRIELAKELLRHPQMSIIEASARTGFC